MLLEERIGSPPFSHMWHHSAKSCVWACGPSPDMEWTVLILESCTSRTVGNGFLLFVNYPVCAVLFCEETSKTSWKKKMGFKNNAHLPWTFWRSLLHNEFTKMENLTGHSECCLELLLNFTEEVLSELEFRRKAVFATCNRNSNIGHVKCVACPGNQDRLFCLPYATRIKNEVS